MVLAKLEEIGKGILGVIEEGGVQRSDNCPIKENQIFEVWNDQSPEDKKDIDKNIDCHNIVGEGKFVTPPDMDVLTDNYDEGSIHQDCEQMGIIKCDDIKDKDKCLLYSWNTSAITDENNIDHVNTDKPCYSNITLDNNGEEEFKSCEYSEHFKFDPIKDQCHYINPEKWYLEQQGANPRRDNLRSKVWGSGGIKDEFWAKYNRSPFNTNDRQLDRTKFLHSIGGIEILNIHTPEKMHGDIDKQIKHLKKEINKSRGGKVICKKNGEFINSDLKGYANWAKCNEVEDENYSYFGPSDLIIEEVRDWVETVVFNDTTGFPDDAFYDYDYEKCMNDLLYIGGFKDEEEILDNIKTYTSFNELKHRDKKYLKLKLKKLAQLKPEDAHSCMDHLDIGNKLNKELCKTGLTVKVQQLAHIIIEILGLSLDFENIEVDSEEHRKLNEFLDDVIPIIPDVIKNIIEISEYYEKKNCPSGKNINTELLKRVYIDLFDSENNYMIDFDIPYKLEDIKEMNIYEILKIVLVVLVGTYVISTLIHSFAEIIGIFKSVKSK